MAYTSYGVNDAAAVKVWSKKAALQALKSTVIAPLIGESEDSIIYLKNELKKGAGDRIRCTLFTTPTGDGFTENEDVEGNAESLTNYTDDLVINELGHAVGVKSVDTIDAQRVPYDLRKTSMDLLSQWWANRYSVTFFNQVCGNTAVSNTKFTGLQATVAPSANRIIRAASAATDQALTSSDTFTLDLIDRAKERAETADVPVVPIMIDGEKKYVMYIHDYQQTSLRTNTSTGQWLDIQKAAMQGGKVSNSPIFKGALGEYNGVILRKANDVTQGVHGSTGAAISTVRRAVLLGAQSAAMAFGQRNQPSKFRWNEELLDHKRKLEVSAWSIFGLKKCIYNSEDFGTVVVSTYAAAAS